MKRFLILIAVFVFLSLPALAEERIDLSTNGKDQLYAYALPDGRTIFAGSASTKGNYQDSRARLLCMNSDGTIAWDYLHPAKGNCSFGNVQLLPDGTLGVILRNSPTLGTYTLQPPPLTANSPHPFSSMVTACCSPITQ